MPTRKLLSLLALVVVLGGGAIFYIEKSSTSNELSSTGLDSNAPESTEISAEEDTDSVSAGVTKTEPTPTTEPAPTTNQDQSGSNSSSFDKELTELNSLYDAGYDDSSLNSTFTSDGANTLTDSYDY